MTRNIQEYECAYLADYGFEAVQVHYRRRLLIERLQRYAPRVVLEVGCGEDLVYPEYRRQGGHVDQWIIVEPAHGFADKAARATVGDGAVAVIRGLLEDSVQSVRSALRAEVDLVLCSGLLHEVPDPQRLLECIAAVMSQRTILHANVPNADSFHRRLARAMDLLADLKSLSERNRKLQQHRVYDAALLRAHFMEAGLTVVEEGGCFVKPFTHAQMERIAPEIGTPVLDGLYELGREAPDWASEIFAEGRRSAT